MEKKEDKRLAIAPVTPKNRITIPGSVLKEIGVHDGDMIGFFKTDQGIVIKKMRVVVDETPQK